MEGDEEGEYTYIGGRGSSVTDYLIGEEEVRKEVTSMRILDRVESDHQPLEVSLIGEGRREYKGERKRIGGRRGRWLMEEKWAFAEKMGEGRVGGEDH